MNYVRTRNSAAVLVCAFLLVIIPLFARAGEAQESQPAGESKVVVEIPRTQWCQCVRALLGAEGGDIAGCVKSGASEEKLKIYRQRGANWSSSTVKALLAFAGCSESENENEGSLSFAVQWKGQPPSSAAPGPGAQAPAAAAVPIACEAGGISAIQTTLYQPSKDKLASAGPWDCSHPIGTLNNIPVGSNVGFLVLGKNAAGNVLYRGEQPGIAIEYHKTTSLGNVIALSFTPVLLAPENGAMLGTGQVRFSWNTVPGAATYQLQVSGDPGFASTVIDTTTSSPSYEATKALASGAYYWRVKATDVYSNNGEWSTPASATVDAEPPANSTTAQCINKGAAATNGHDVRLSIAAAKKTGITGYFVSERSKKPEAGKTGWTEVPSTPSYTAEIPYTLSKGDGKKTVSVWFKDAFGHVSAAKSCTIMVDTKLPHTTITSHPTVTTNATTADFTYTSSKARSTFQCRLDDGLYSDCSGTKTYDALREGPHTFLVKATDPAGNTDQNPAGFTWTIDVSVPETTITSQPPARTGSASAHFEFTSSKAGSTFQCKLDAGAYAPCINPRDYNSLAEGQHTFAVRAIDSIGNVDPTPPSYSWTVFTAPFRTTITSQPTNPSASSTASFSFTSNRDGVAYQCRLDNSAPTECESPHTYAGLSDGAHRFRVKAIDVAAKAESTPAEYAWAVGDPQQTIEPAAPVAMVEGVAIMASPAFTMIGADPEIIQPGTPRDLAISYMEGVDVTGRTEIAVAVDMAPALLFSSHKPSLQEYQDSMKDQMLSRIQLSFALARASSVNDNMRRFGAAVQWTIWDDSDIRLDRSIVSCLDLAQSEEDNSGSSGRTTKRRSEAAVLVNNCRQESFRRNWNRSAMDVGIAPVWARQSGEGGGLSSDGLGFWTSYSYGFDSYEGLKDNSQLILHARYRINEDVPAAFASTKYSEQDTYSFGARFRTGEPDRLLFLQGLFVETHPKGQSTGHSYVFSLGTELAIKDDLWIEFEMGTINGARIDGNAGFATAQIKTALFH